MDFPDDVPTRSDGTVTLRALELSDVDAMVVQCNDPESVEWTPVPVPYTRDDGIAYVTQVVPAGWRDGTSCTFAIEFDGRYAGSLSLRRELAGAVELSYGLHPAARGRGVCSRAVKLLLDWAFTERGHATVLWYARVGNWAARRVAWANGFTVIGTVPGLFQRRGERYDAWFASLRADDERAPRHPWHVAPVLESDRLRLRPFADADAGRFDEILRDPRARHFGGHVRSDRVTAADVMLRHREADARGEGFGWCVADRETDRLLGNIQLFELGGLDDTHAKVGYSTHPDSRGRGVLTQALRMVTEWAFRPVEAGGLGRRRLSLGTAASNKASRHAAERAGFTNVATEPSAFPLGDGDFDDKCVYARVNPDWTPPRAPS